MPLPWEMPQSPIFSMFGVVGGTPEQEAGRAAAEKAYDYAMAEAEAESRRQLAKNPWFAAGNTPEDIDRELFEPLRARWSAAPSGASAFSYMRGPSGEVLQLPRFGGQPSVVASAQPGSVETVKVGGTTFAKTTNPDGTIRMYLADRPKDEFSKADSLQLNAFIKSYTGALDMGDEATANTYKNLIDGILAKQPKPTSVKPTVTIRGIRLKQ